MEDGKDAILFDFATCRARTSRSSDCGTDRFDAGLPLAALPALVLALPSFFFAAAAAAAAAGGAAVAKLVSALDARFEIRLRIRF